MTMLAWWNWFWFAPFAAPNTGRALMITALVLLHFDHGDDLRDDPSRVPRFARSYRIETTCGLTPKVGTIRFGRYRLGRSRDLAQALTLELPVSVPPSASYETPPAPCPNAAFVSSSAQPWTPMHFSAASIPLILQADQTLSQRSFSA